MGRPGSSRSTRLTVRIDVQNDFRDFLPLGAFAVGVEKAKVSDYVLLIVDGEHIGHRRRVGHVRIK